MAATTTKSAKSAKVTLCFCGCGAEVKPGKKFKQGHDATFKSRVLQVARGQMKLADVPPMHPAARKLFREMVKTQRDQQVAAKAASVSSAETSASDAVAIG